MQIVIIGAGAIGGFFAGLWSQAGLDVTLLGRARQADEYANGVTIHAGDWQAHAQPEFTADPAALAQADLIVLTVKCTATLTAAEDIASHARPGTPVLSLQNGVSNATTLAAALPDFPVLPGMVRFNVVPAGPAAWQRASEGHVIAQRHPILNPITTASAGSIAKLEQVKNMEPIAWGKLLLNLNNAINALSGLPLRDELWQRPYRRVFAAAQREALSLLETANIRPAKVGTMSPHLMPYLLSLPDVLFRPIASRTQRISPTARTSMSEDFAQNRPSEIDHLNGEVVDLANRYGLEAPVNARLVELVRDAENGGRRDWTGRDLARAVLSTRKS